MAAVGEIYRDNDPRSHSRGERTLRILSFIDDFAVCEVRLAGKPTRETRVRVDRLGKKARTGYTLVSDT